MAKGRPSAASLRLQAELLARARRFARCGKRLRRAATPGAVHDARVATRRFHEALGLLRARARTLRDLARIARRARHALRQTRDTDVALAWFSRLRPRGAAERKAVADLLERLRLRRAHCRRHVTAAAGRWPRKPARAFKLAIAPQHLGASLEIARRQVALRLGEAIAEGRRVAVLTDLDAFHAFRIAVKRLRYASEMLDAARGARNSRRVSRLQKLQDTLGRLNDLRTFRKRAFKRARRLAKSTSPCHLGEGYAALVRRIDSDLGRSLRAAIPLVRATLSDGGWRDFREGGISSRRERR